MEKKQMY